MPRFSLHAVGTNRPGIALEVTEAIAAQGWDIVGSSMLRLEGQFVIAVVLDSGMIADGRFIEQALSQAAEEADLFLAVLPINAATVPRVSSSTISFSLSGANHPGIVAGIAKVLANAGADICTLDSRLVEGDHPGFVMEVEAALPEGAPRSEIESSILRVAADLGAECVITMQGG
jgi:glycine cleavage system regulatory protein